MRLAWSLEKQGGQNGPIELQLLVARLEQGGSANGLASRWFTMTFFSFCPRGTLSCAGSDQVGGEISQVLLVSCCPSLSSLYLLATKEQAETSGPL